MIRIHRNINLLYFASDEIAKEVQATSSTQEKTQLSFSPTAHLLKEEQIDKLLNELVKKGYTPRVEAP